MAEIVVTKIALYLVGILEYDQTKYRNISVVPRGLNYHSFIKIEESDFIKAKIFRGFTQRPLTAKDRTKINNK